MCLLTGKQPHEPISQRGCVKIGTTQRISLRGCVEAEMTQQLAGDSRKRYATVVDPTLTNQNRINPVWIPRQRQLRLRVPTLSVSTRQSQWYCPKLGMTLTPGIQSRPISWLRHFTKVDWQKIRDTMSSVKAKELGVTVKGRQLGELIRQEQIRKIGELH